MPYLIFSCPFCVFGIKRARHNRKYYAIDTGLRRAIRAKGGEDLGKDFENMVFLALRRKTNEVCYWKGEVDFVITTRSGTPTPIQVTYDKPLRAFNRGPTDSLFLKVMPLPHPIIIGPLSPMG